jgi:hypothetical protein
VNATESTQRRDLDEAEREIRRLSQELIRLHDSAFKAEAALRNLLDAVPSRRRWWPHPLLQRSTDGALLREIERRGIARWQVIVGDRRAEVLAESILDDIKRRSQDTSCGSAS